MLPEAVITHEGVIPDIQKVCTFSGSNINWCSSNINVGDTINLVNEDGSNGGINGYDVKVVNVAPDYITIDSPEKMTGSNVFVYGRKVKDFLGVNQDTISAVTVGAVQRLSAKVDDLYAIVRYEPTSNDR